MKLRTLRPTRIGPFAPDRELTFEPDVTVITGRNDVGKSALLRLIAMSCARRVNDVATEGDVNFDYLVGASRNWEGDDSLACIAEFVELNENKNPSIYTVQLAPQRWEQSVFRHTQGGSHSGPKAHRFLPSILHLSAENESVRQELTLTSLNPTEKRFISVAFGPDFSFDALRSLSELAYEAAISRAEEVLNRRLSALLPSTLAFRFRFRTSSEKRERLFLSLRDGHGCSTALGHRGSGVQKMVTLLGRLAIENIGNTPAILLLDEPENSLHADAQHTLRRALEDLAQQNTNIQVVYTTHSPCMVNPMRPHSLRLLQRVQNGESAMTVMDSKPYTGNFSAVRTSLGLGPADSLLYAPLCIIVEGKTEALCLPMLLHRLHAAGVESFKNVPTVLSQSLFLEATGSGSVSELCRLAKAQGTRVIAFTDGDNGNRWKAQMQKAHADVPLVTLPDRQEFEELVPASVYLRAVSHQLGTQELSEAQFKEWCSNTTLPAWMGYTKRLERWINDHLDRRFSGKAETMRTAVESVDVSAITTAPLIELLTHMEAALLPS